MTTISRVSKSLGISTRMLRYYEQVGLIASQRREGYAYRIYDEVSMDRLRQILILRKLRIPVKQIKLILQQDNAVMAIEVSRQHIRELDAEISALSTIESILQRFVEELQATANTQIPSLVAADETILASIADLSLISINFKEDRMMERLNQTDESLVKLSDVRIIYLPPATVAAAHYIGDDPESQSYGMIDRFVRETDLCKIKPDLRHYGFNHPNPVDESGRHGYEVWVTIPDDWEVPAPLRKQHFAGGLYAAHMMAMGNFNEWQWLLEWVSNNEKYEFAGDFQDQEHMCGLLDEHLNYVGHVTSGNTEPEDLQIDLLMPIRERAK